MIIKDLLLTQRDWKTECCNVTVSIMYEMTDLLKAEPNMDSDDSRDGGRYDQGTRSPLVKHPDTEPKLTTFTKALVTFAAIGGFLFGYDTGVVSGAMILIKDEFNLTTVWEEVVVCSRNNN